MPLRRLPAGEVLAGGPDPDPGTAPPPGEPYPRPGTTPPGEPHPHRPAPPPGEPHPHLGNRTPTREPSRARAPPQARTAGASLPALHRSIVI